MRFCSRCGFPLGNVMQLVATGGELRTPEAQKKPKRSATMRGVRLGTWIMLASIAFSLFVGFLAALEEDFVVLLLPAAVVFLVGFLRLLYAVFVQDRRELHQKEVETNVVAALLGQAPMNVRPQVGHPFSMPVETFTRPIKTTAEVVQPPSVTENTTRFLDDEADDQRRRNPR
jgi:UDP-N-acetylmuramyl pentapeptide phosphotransferase/UDP-N-acetylglucosamine-1-phosphate transferase